MQTSSPFLLGTWTEKLGRLSHGGWWARRFIRQEDVTTCTAVSVSFVVKSGVGVCAEYHVGCSIGDAVVGVRRAVV